MAFLEYVPLRSVSRVGRWYKDVYSTLDNIDYGGKSELDVVNDLVTPAQRELFTPLVRKNQMSADLATILGINDKIFLLITKEWIHSKQVYSFSQDFLDMLCDMDDFEIDADLLKFLPFSSFYIELPKNDMFHGVLIRYSPEEKMIFYCICYNKFDYYEGLNAGILDLNRFKKFSEFATLDVGVARNEKEQKDIETHLHMLGMIFQICLYLCSENSDVEENENQKKIYKPSVTIKNRYSEIRKWDVGYRVMREHKKAREKAEKDWETKHSGIRHRPRMHWRKAHWHTFWCGKGRTIKKVNFIAPILVNKDTDDEVPVVNRVQ